MNFDAVPAASQFTESWYTYAGCGRWSVCDLKNNEVVICTEDELISAGSDFASFKNRQEYAVGRPVQLNGRSIESIAEDFDTLLCGALLIRWRRENPEAFAANEGKYMTSITAWLNWLHGTDFYKAPASTQYHDSIPGGLMIHSLNVYNSMLTLRDTDKFKSVPIDSATLICLVHDWCKIGLYEEYEKNEKQGDKWVKVKAFKHNQTGLPMGHGVTSMFLASKMVKLTNAEAIAIRWHQGRWNVCREEMNEFQKACETYPEVHLVQFADQLAIVNY